MRRHTTADLSGRFTDQSFFRALPPAWISALGLALGDMADALVMGQSMGATGLAAVSLALPVFMVINLFMHGLGAGGSIHFSKLLGSGQCEDANKSFSQVLQGTVILGILLAFLGNVFLQPLMFILGTTPGDGAVYEASSTYVQMIISGIPLFFLSYLLNYYLRNDDNQQLASLGFTVGNLCDLALNLVLVLVLDMGVVGAALSTIIGQGIALSIYIPGLLGKRSHNLTYRPVALKVKEVFFSFRIGFSTSVQYSYQMLFVLLVNNSLMRGIGADGVAVFDVLQNISFLVMYLYEGAAKASQPLVSTFCGEHNRPGIRRSGKLALIWGSVGGGLLCLLVSVFSGTVCRIFGLESDALIALGSYALRLYCFSLLFAGVSSVLELHHQAQEDRRSAIFLATLRGAIVLLPCTFLFSLLDIRYFWLLFPVVEILSLAIFLIWRRFAPREEVTQEASLSCIISSSSDAVSKLTAQLEEFCEAHNATPKQSYFVMMAVEEVCVALMEKAFTDTKDGLIQVTVIACLDGSFELHIRDNAVKFNAFSLAVSEGKIASAAWDSVGMSIIQKKASAFFYRHYQGFNTLYIKI